MVGAFIAELVHYYETAVKHGAVLNISLTASIAINKSISSDDTSVAGINVFYKTNNTDPSLSPTVRSAPRPRGWDTRRPWYVFFTYSRTGPLLY
ncbi:hypothetical protein PoB_001545700 [Plakobranchus ocellatus]|uniref:Uncharacterized protein n=1 Tax=Plakobranchus ocellatus TaxID=259542 RepID=A0AAV3Z181_9GAST|nr:hypothetical protein PoB_001545700 [Plakobranchus ocellatus]